MKGEVYPATVRARRAMGQDVCVVDLRDGSESGSLNPLDLAMRCGTDLSATARSFAAELIEREVDERDRFWNDWSETMIAGSTAWLLADRPAEERHLSALFDLFTCDDVVYQLAALQCHAATNAQYCGVLPSWRCNSATAGHFDIVGFQRRNLTTLYCSDFSTLRYL